MCDVVWAKYQKLTDSHAKRRREMVYLVCTLGIGDVLKNVQVNLNACKQ